MKTHSDKKVVEERINEHNESAANLILSNIGQIGGKPFKNKRTYRKRKRTYKKRKRTYRKRKRKRTIRKQRNLRTKKKTNGY